MSLETLEVVLVLLMAPAATLFPILYATTGPWWTHFVGRALMTKAVGLAVLIDSALIFEFVGYDWPGADWVHFTAVLLVAVGIWFQFIAFLREKHRVVKRRKQMMQGLDH